MKKYIFLIMILLINSSIKSAEEGYEYADIGFVSKEEYNKLSEIYNSMMKKHDEIKQTYENLRNKYIEQSKDHKEEIEKLNLLYKKQEAELTSTIEQLKEQREDLNAKIAGQELKKFLVCDKKNNCCIL